MTAHPKRRGPRRHFHDPGEWNDEGIPTLTVAEVICRELGRGLPQEMAARYAGANYATFRDWLVDGRALLRRQQTEPDFAATDAEAELMEFCLQVSEAQAGWVQRANGVLEAMMYDRRRVTTKTVWEVAKAEDGTESLTAIERHVTEITEPIDVTAIQWRLSRVAPQIYSAMPRYEQESEAGESEEIDIAKTVVELMDRIANTLTIAPEDPV